MEIIGEMSAARAEAVMRTIAACLNTVITWDHPMLEGELPLDGSRFAGQLPPVVAAPAGSFRPPFSLALPSVSPSLTFADSCCTYS
jgi:Flp pilus assembly CpaF family ATPase